MAPGAGGPKSGPHGRAGWSLWRYSRRSRVRRSRSAATYRCAVTAAGPARGQPYRRRCRRISGNRWRTSTALSWRARPRVPSSLGFGPGWTSRRPGPCRRGRLPWMLCGRWRRTCAGAGTALRRTTSTRRLPTRSTSEDSRSTRSFGEPSGAMPRRSSGAWRGPG